MKRLLEVEPGRKVTVRRIDCAFETRVHLAESGISEGSELYVTEKIPQVHEGPVLLEVGEIRETMCQEWAERIDVEAEGQSMTLFELEEGRAVVKDIKGGRDFKVWLRDLGIAKGAGVKLVSHLPNNNLVVRVWARDIELDPGTASKLLVDCEGKMIQLNDLEEGKTASLVRAIGDSSAGLHILGGNLRPGLTFKMVRREADEPVGGNRCFVKVDVGDKTTTVGCVEAEKVLVD